MKIEFYSHACARINDSSVDVLFDPWLIGDTFWGAWRLTPNACIQPEEISVDFLAISHWHFDHLNLPTLRRLNKHTPVLVPKFPITWMPQTLKKIGFKEVIELDHGVQFPISSDVSITMYQCQYQDDAVIVHSGRYGSVINLNDAKPLRRGMAVIKRNSGKVLATLRSHSYAWSYPSRFEFVSGNPIPIDDSYYIDQFFKDSSFFEPQLMVGFASGISHPLEGHEKENEFLVSFDRVKSRLNETVDLKCPIVSGSSGVSIEYRDGNWTTAQNCLQPLPYAVTINKSLRRFDRANLESTKGRLQQFYDLTKLIGFFKKFRYSVGFFDLEGNFIVGLDARTGVVDESLAKFDIEYKIDPSILHDALKRLIFTNIDISKLWIVRVNGDLNKHFIFTGLFALYEHGYFKVKNIFCRRFFRQWYRRRGEIFDYISLVMKAIFSRKTFAQIFSEK